MTLVDGLAKPTLGPEGLPKRSSRSINLRRPYRSALSDDDTGPQKTLLPLSSSISTFVFVGCSHAHCSRKP